jgi:His/Glu/Gln/Arg/opine family amino acid ABC transporter permease subunit
MGSILPNLPFMLEGLVLTFGLAALSIVGSSLLGTALATARLSPALWLRVPATTCIEVVRSIPAVLFVLFTYFVLADAGVNVAPFWAAAIALSVFASSYIAEVIRAGILAVDRGQTEAARASGLSHLSTMRLVVLPQAVRSMAPALVSEFIKLTKDSSLAAVIGVLEFFNRVNLVNSRLITQSFVLFGFAGVVYFVVNYGLSRLARRMELRADV